MEEAHRSFRKTMKKTRGAAPAVTDMRHVVFSACQDREVAYESNGHGDFTLRAIELLKQGTAGLTHESFQQRVMTAFGEGRRQNPNLECSPAARSLGLLQALGAAAAPAASAPSRTPEPEAAASLLQASPGTSRQDVAELLRRVAKLIES
jgi:hypothetical protein